MNHIQASVAALNELINELKSAKTIFERSALFAAIRVLVDDLQKEDLNDYAKEKLSEIRWHSAAALGFDETNGHKSLQHRAWALGALSSLESQID